jgi:hypothetical protein
MTRISQLLPGFRQLSGFLGRLKPFSFFGALEFRFDTF